MELQSSFAKIANTISNGHVSFKGACSKGKKCCFNGNMSIGYSVSEFYNATLQF